MCKNATLLYAFIGGAIVWAGAALLFAPQRGEDLRQQIKSLCNKYGLTKNKGEAEVERLVDEITASIAVSAQE